jgi:hypothetical protein
MLRPSKPKTDPLALRSRCQTLGELGWLFPERQYLKKIPLDIAAG